MLLIGLEARASAPVPFRPLLPMLPRLSHYLPREPAKREFLFRSSRASARGVLLSFQVPSHGRTDVTIWARRKSRVQPGEVIHVNFK